MTGNKKLSGWGRLWVVVSVVWTLVVLAGATVIWFNESLDDKIASHMVIYNNMNSDQKSLILDSNLIDYSIKVIKINIEGRGDLYIDGSIGDKALEEFVDIYYKLGRAAQIKRRFNFISISLGVIFLLPILFAIIGKTYAWVVDGFRR